MSSAEPEYLVSLYVYDITRGMAKQFAPMFNLNIDAIYHTGIVVYNIEYFYGGGITYGTPGNTVAGNPLQILELGKTQIPQEIFHEFLTEIGSQFTMSKYSLIDHNCNHFTNEVSLFLLGKGIPDYIVNLPNNLLATPIGQMVGPMIMQMQNNAKQSFDPYGGFGGGDDLPQLPPLSSLNKNKPNSISSKTESKSNINTKIAPSFAPNSVKSSSSNLIDGNLIQSKYSRPFISKTGEMTKLRELLIKNISQNSNINLEAMDELINWYTTSSASPLPNTSLSFFQTLFTQFSSQYKIMVIILSILRLTVSKPSAAKIFSSDNFQFIHTFIIDNIIFSNNFDADTSKLAVVALPILANLFSDSDSCSIISKKPIMYKVVSKILQHDSVTLLHCATDLSYNLMLKLPNDLNQEEDILLEILVRITELLGSKPFVESSGLHALLVLYYLCFQRPTLRELFQDLEGENKISSVLEVLQDNETQEVGKSLIKLLRN